MFALAFGGGAASAVLAHGSGWDAEVDPVAYALHGYSLHVGVNDSQVRYELGAYAAHVPRWAHGNEGFDAAMSGIGVKLQYFLDRAQAGWFIGAGIGSERERLHNLADDQRVTHTLWGVGIEGGYRFELGGATTPRRGPAWTTGRGRAT